MKIRKLTKITVLGPIALVAIAALSACSSESTASPVTAKAPDPAPTSTAAPVQSTAIPQPTATAVPIAVPTAQSTATPEPPRATPTPTPTPGPWTPISPGLKIEVVRNVDYVEEADYEDRQDQLDLYLPEGQDDFPVLFLIHPGALMVGGKEEFEVTAKFFASQGFGSAAINYRVGVPIPRHIEDTARAFAWIHENIQSYGGNPDEIFVVGHSAGAYLAALLATDGKYLADHGLSLSNIRGVAPISRLFYVGSKGLVPGISSYRPVSVWGTDVDGWIEASPAQYVSAEVPPILLLYASRDAPWRREQNEDFAADLRLVEHTNVVTKKVNRDHISILARMGKSTDETTRALLDFVVTILQSQ